VFRGYKVHITRAEHWAKNEGCEIPASEWHDLVKGDPELRLACANGPHFAVWNTNAGQPGGWLDWNNGNITTKTPDEQLLAKMIEIAERLGAKVQGDDGELYHSLIEAATAVDSSPSANAPLVSFVLSLVALVAVAVAAPMDLLVRQQYPAGASIPLPWALAFAAMTIVGGLCWLVAAVLAVRSLAARQARGYLAIAAIATDILAVCVFRFFR
jgi:hypothetical protein